MAKVLLKHVGKKTYKKYQKNASKISKIALASKKGTSPQMNIYSRQELTMKVVR